MYTVWGWCIHGVRDREWYRVGGGTHAMDGWREGNGGNKGLCRTIRGSIGVYMRR